jgi:hypothetical protein
MAKKAEYTVKFVNKPDISRIYRAWSEIETQRAQKMGYNVKVTVLPEEEAMEEKYASERAV